MTNADRRIAAIATGQLGAFTRAQANDVGLSDRQLRSRVQSGFLTQTGPNAFRAAGAPTSPRSELMDLMTDLGEPVWCCGPTAAALHGFDDFKLRRPFHVLVPRRRSLNRWNVKVHRSDTIDLVDRDRVDGFDLTSAARTLVELARTLPSEMLATCLDSALRDGKLSERSLHETIVRLRSQGRFGLPTLHEVLGGYEVTRGGHSWLEREYLRLLAAAALPRPVMQQVLTRAQDRLVRVDCHFPGTNVVVELLGYRWHRSRAQMSRDSARLNALVADGFSPYQFTYGQIVAEAAYVIETSRAALAPHSSILRQGS
jgi:very-short-patch-repair endonuclease